MEEVITCPVCGNPVNILSKSFKVGDSAPVSNISRWIRLYSTDKILATSFISEETGVTRELFHKNFRNLFAPLGAPISAYSPSNGKPLFYIFLKRIVGI